MSERLWATFVVPLERIWDAKNNCYYKETPPVTECMDASGTDGIHLLDARFSRENLIIQMRELTMRVNKARNAGYIGFWIGKGIGEKPTGTPVIFLDGVTPLKHVRGCDL